MRVLEMAVMLGGDTCPVIRGTNGLRKIRFSPPNSTRGKRESFRVCFCLFPEYGIALMTTVFGKNEKSDLSGAGRAAVSKLIAAVQEALEQGKIR